MGRGAWSRRVGAAAVVAALTLTGCEGATDPEFASGSLSFTWAESDATPQAWQATGSCGSAGFILGAETCAVGSEESNYWAVLGVRRSPEGGFGVVTVAHPKEEGTCEASATPSDRCGLAFEPSRPSGSGEPGPYYLLSSGTVTVTRVEEDGSVRLTGSFEGMATDPNDLLPPLRITDGVFDVELVR